MIPKTCTWRKQVIRGIAEQLGLVTFQPVQVFCLVAHQHAGAMILL